MKKTIRFSVHVYAPELNKMEYFINNQWIAVSLPTQVTSQFTKNQYQLNMQVVRKYWNEKSDSIRKSAKIELIHSFQRYNEVTTPKHGMYTTTKELLQFVRQLRDINRGEKNLYIGEDSNGKSIYESINNECFVMLTISCK